MEHKQQPFDDGLFKVISKLYDDVMIEEMREQEQNVLFNTQVLMGYIKSVRLITYLR